MREQILNRARANLECLMKLTTGSPFRLLHVEGGWYATLEAPRIYSEEDLVLLFLEKDDVMVHPGYFFDFPREAFLVVSLLPKTEMFTEAINRLCERMK